MAADDADFGPGPDNNGRLNGSIADWSRPPDDSPTLFSPFIRLSGVQ